MYTYRRFKKKIWSIIYIWKSHLGPGKVIVQVHDQKLILIIIILLIMREKARGLKLEPSCDDISAGLSLSVYEGPEMTFVVICSFINKTELT